MRTPSAPHDAATSWAEVQPGTTLAGRYVVEGVLGQGGMGVVLGALDRTTGFEVALKVLLPGGAKIDGGKERFLREARAASSLSGPHVALVIDTGTLPDGTPYMVMERLFGQDLRVELYQRGRLPHLEAAGLLLQACEALAEAHGRGIVHRDLKPGNLFLAQQIDGSIALKVLDFGLAKVVEGMEINPEGLTRTGVVVGSPPYMSPEQLRSLKLADARSDVWSLGVIAYEMVTGQRPFQGITAAGLIASIIADAPEPPRKLVPEMAEAFDGLILRCLQKDPKGRPQTIAEVATVLRGILSTAPAARRPALSEPSITQVAAPGRIETGLVETGHLRTGRIETDPNKTSALKTGDIETGLVETGHIEAAHLAAAHGVEDRDETRYLGAGPPANVPVLPSPAGVDPTATMPLPGLADVGVASAESLLAASGPTSTLTMGSTEVAVPPPRETAGGRRPVLIAAAAGGTALVLGIALLLGGNGATSGEVAGLGAGTARPLSTDTTPHLPAGTTPVPTETTPPLPSETTPPLPAGTTAPLPAETTPPLAADTASSGGVATSAPKASGAPRGTSTSTRPKRPGNTSDWR